MEPRWREQPGGAFTPALSPCSKPTQVGLEQLGAQALPCHASVLPPKPESSVTGAHQMTTASQAASVLCPLLQVSELATATALPMSSGVNRTADTCLLTNQSSPSLSNFSKKI